MKALGNRCPGGNVVAFVLEALAPLQAHAFGTEGHQMVAALAEPHVTAHARAEIGRLLSFEPGSTMVSISTWADETRTPSTAAWHYVNLLRDADCQYDTARGCPDGQCVVAAIERQRKVLASSAPELERLKARKYIVHFVADVYQPLHTGDADDRGGNKYQVQAFGRGTNLHADWVSALVAQWPGGPSALFTEVSTSAMWPEATTPAQWAQESCRIVGSSWFYPQSHKLETSYPQWANSALKERLGSAVRRLATLLNANLGAVGFRHVQPIHAFAMGRPRLRGPGQSRRQLPAGQHREDWSVRHGCIRPLPCRRAV